MTRQRVIYIELKTPKDIQRELAARFRARRLEMNLTQEGLAVRTGVSWSSLKRFEYTGLIAVDALLKLALALECLHDFEHICPDDEGRNLSSKTLDEILADPKKRKKGRIK
jgi:transcriptional regulator with XRE-family HTH domain